MGTVTLATLTWPFAPTVSPVEARKEEVAITGRGMLGWARVMPHKAVLWPGARRILPAWPVDMPSRVSSKVSGMSSRAGRGLQRGSGRSKSSRVVVAPAAVVATRLSRRISRVRVLKRLAGSVMTRATRVRGSGSCPW